MAGYCCTIVVLLVLHFHFGSNVNISSPVNQQIRERVLNNYDRFAFPERHLVAVKVGIHVLNLDLDFHASKFIVTAWLRVTWTDNRLKWNPKNYSNVDLVRFGYNEIWKPEITVANSIKPAIMGRDTGLDCIVFQGNTSSVVLIHPVVFEVYCNTDISKWPTGTQFCTIILETVGSLNTVVYMSPDQNTIGEDMLLDNWEISRTTVNHNIYNGKKNIVTLSEVEFCFFIKKKHSFYFSFIKLPALVMTLLVLAVFWLPPYITEKYSITAINSITCCLLLILMCRKAPVMLSQTPNIITFYGSTMCLSMTYLVVSLITFNLCTIHSTTMKPLPRIVIKALNSNFVNYLHISIKKDGVKRDTVSSGISERSNKNISSSSNDNENDVIQIGHNDQCYQLAAVIDRLMFLVYIVIFLFFLIRFIL